MSHDDGPGKARETGRVPDVEAARDHVVDELVRFVRALRRSGAAVPANATLPAARALVELGFEREASRAGLAAALLTRQEDRDAFERLFPAFWRRLTEGLEPEQPADRPGGDASEGGRTRLEGGPAPADGEPIGEGDDVATVDLTDPSSRTTGEGAGGNGGEDGDVATTSAYSPTGTPSQVDAAATLHRETSLGPAMRRLTAALATLEGRRFTRGGDGPVDARRALRESLGTGGAVLGVPRTDRDPAAVTGTLLVDVSRSVLDVIDEGLLLEFILAARSAWRRATVFFFDEDVREVSTAFDGPTTADALAALERAEAEWGGGTRIGHAVDTVRQEHHRSVDRDTVVIVVSDGLEMGDLDELAAGMAWLSRRSAAVLWLNPLAGAPDYEPVARGMETALPYVDGLFAFTEPADLVEVARQLRLNGVRGTIGYEHDPRRQRA